ncbi:hypothetical protein GW17_00054120 [Ensete ventricosum]|nr:hypothetical protein GW17_00054120 [Ensete ventricosum]
MLCILLFIISLTPCHLLNFYLLSGGLYQSSEVDEVIEEADKVDSFGQKLSASLPPSGREDVSILTSQRLKDHVPSTALEMVVDYYAYDYEFAEPPRVTSLQNTVPLPTFTNFGEDVYFVADQRGYESLVYDLAGQFLRTARNGSIVDPRLLLGKVNTRFLTDLSSQKEHLKCRGGILIVLRVGKIRL